MSGKDFEPGAHGRPVSVFGNTKAADRMIKAVSEAPILLAAPSYCAAIGQTRALAPPVFIGGFRAYTVMRKRPGGIGGRRQP